jgi:hypothetical protein
MPLIDGVRQGILAHTLPAKTTPVDADEFPITDSAAGWAAKRFTWANLKAAVSAAMKVTAPANSTAAGKPGQWATSATHVFFYTGNGTTHSWGRVLMETVWAAAATPADPVTDDAPVEAEAPAKTTKN